MIIEYYDRTYLKSPILHTFLQFFYNKFRLILLLNLIKIKVSAHFCSNKYVKKGRFYGWKNNKK